MDLYERGIRLSSGDEYQFDMVIFALGYDAATGALSDMEVEGSHGKSLRDFWGKKVDIFAGVLVPGFPNMFSICGPHVPFGNMPVVLDIEIKWVGKTLRHMMENKHSKINVTQKAVDSWNAHLHEVFNAILFADYALNAGAWFVGADTPGKPKDILFYFGSVPTWAAWLDEETKSAWAGMEFSPLSVTNGILGSEHYQGQSEHHQHKGMSLAH